MDSMASSFMWMIWQLIAKSLAATESSSFSAMHIIRLSPPADRVYVIISSNWSKHVNHSAALFKSLLTFHFNTPNQQFLTEVLTVSSQISSGCNIFW
uniref:Secreted protein n=1 Tax=Trichuris muris TaxID=70415 RepID=A0A5S6Q2H5_TRIMR